MKQICGVKNTFSKKKKSDTRQYNLSPPNKTGTRSNVGTTTIVGWIVVDTDTADVDHHGMKLLLPGVL